MLSEADIKKAADDLYQAEIDRQQIDPVSLAHPDMTMDEAYAIQKQWVDRKVGDGRRIVGYKIGLTSRAMQDTMKIDHPDYGVLLDDMVFADGSDIETARFSDPRIEVELAFVLKDRLEGEKRNPVRCAQCHRLRGTGAGTDFSPQPPCSSGNRLHPKDF